MNRVKKLLACALVCMLSAAPVCAEETAPVSPTGEGMAVPVETAEPELVDLAPGAKGDDVLRLQQRLAELGFFFTAEDGKYGANTKNAVMEFETYLRRLEQDEIDRLIEANKTPEPTETPEPTVTPEPALELTEQPTDQPVSSGEPQPEQTQTPEPQPTETPVPTPEPTPQPTPETPADGLADTAVQKILFADADELYRRDVSSGDKGEDVLRIQRRLIYLNYLNDEPDYRFGANTENAVKAFQQAHDLNATGVADRATQAILFSSSAVRADQPVYNQLYLWKTGENVRELQKQLRLLGFTNSKVSGTFDENTQAAVKLLETYLHELDMKEQGVAIVTATSMPVPEEILDQQGEILGDPESNPYEVSDEPRIGDESVQPEAAPEAADGAGADETEAPPASITPDADAENTPETDGAADSSDGETEAPEASAAPTTETVDETGAPVVTAAPEFSGVVPVNPNGGRPGAKDTFEPTGIVSAEMQIRLFEEGVPVYLQTVQRGSGGEQVRRVQRRLYALGYLTANGVDGIYGKGTQAAVSAFQRRNKLTENGIADRDTQTVLFSEDAVKAIKPYQIKISIKEQRVYVYTHDDKDEYTIEVKKFICSTGLNETPTPKGTFTNTGPGARWHYFKKFECWAQYAYYINGDIMFHSVLYDEQDVSTLRQGSVNALGSKASHGCVRLKVEDAKWIYENCKAGTTVIVY